MTDLYEIKTLLDDTARDLVQVLTTVGELRGWVVYLLEVLEAETQNRVAFAAGQPPRLFPAMVM